MTAAPETRVGWCPGALRPMPSGDGLIVRVKPRGAALSPDQAIGIAKAASTFGNRALDLTSHANLQIRGASDASLPGLTEALDQLGLLDPDVGAETRRNVMMSPLAGFDPEAQLDIRPVVAALENRLVADISLGGLPGKFGFAVSDGGRLPLGDVGADIIFHAGWPSLPGPGRVARSAGWGGGELRVERPATPPDTLRVPPSPSRGGNTKSEDCDADRTTDVTFDAGWRSLPGTGRVARSAGWGGGELRVERPATPPDTLRVPPSPSRGGITQPVDGETDRTIGFTVRLAGDATTVAFCPARSVPDVAVLLAGWFIAACAADPDLRRMRDAVARFGASAILAAAGLRAEKGDPAGAVRHGRVGPGLIFDGVLRSLPETGRVARSAGWGVAGGELRGTRPASPPDTLRVSPSRSGGGSAADTADPEPPAEPGHVLGVAAPFGRLDSAQLDALARGALRAGASELRLTPWRALLIPGLTRAAAERLAEACVAAGLITDPGDPRLRVAACPGAPGCHRGTTPVLDHAARWAALLGPGRIDDGIVLHVSGCAKGCAHPATAPLTLVAEDGRYRLVCDGSAGPTGLDADAVQRLLRAANEGRPT